MLLYRRVLTLLAANMLVITMLLGIPMSASAEEGSGADAAPQAGGIKVMMNGNRYELYTAPLVSGGNVYLPVRDMGRLLGTIVSWNAAAKMVSMKYPELTVRLIYGSKHAIVNDRQVPLPAPFLNLQGQIYAPLRFFSEAAKAEVVWDETSKTVRITRKDTYIQPSPWSYIWLNPVTKEIYRALSDQHPVVLIGKLEGTVKGDISFYNGGFGGPISILTAVDKYTDDKLLLHYDEYSMLVRDNKIVSQKKASYAHSYQSNLTYFQLYRREGWLQRLVITDGKIVNVFDEQGNAINDYDLPMLTGQDEVFTVLNIGEDYLVVRPNRTGLLTLIDLKDHSVVVLADKLLIGEERTHALNNKALYSEDGLNFSGDMGHGSLDFIYYSPLDKKNRSVRLTYDRPSYEEERSNLPKPKSLSELAAVCSPETITSVNLQDGDLLYVPLNSTNKADHESINKVCRMLKKFVKSGVEETASTAEVEGFFHGMSISFADGSYLQVQEAGQNRLSIAIARGKQLVLDDLEAYKDFKHLKILPPRDGG
ncbi:copper amine oxidase N-terminal domain-containing protein [Paenibacillus sp. CF384]|uniref:copper amine oxidase N-terminal domain-containing protein n=1 Tax=Paenibacillus sp. CF384 TaxID=1884382 RepID=UPI0008959D1B|nr:copper amine oxidase N-terminal domain-containing protein [Paenibacillus sp. CF384]SDX03854.1 Copper amine oxidase N-terminal domain-containing protein [Paenibacillus sp. CF384]